MKRIIVGAVAILVLIIAWMLQTNHVLPSSSKSVLLMDTFVTVSATAKDAEALVDKAIAEMARLEKVFSAHIQESEVVLINLSYPEAVKVSPEVIKVLLVAQQMYEESQGAFDVTIGPVLKLWGFGTDAFRVPEEDEIRTTLEGVGFSNVLIDAKHNAVQLLHSSTRLDLGGIAKGYIVDRATELLVQAGARHVLVDAGGDVRVAGGRPGVSVGDPPRKARIGVQNPRAPEELIAIVAIFDGAVLTSGDYQRFFFAEGVRYSHILDPRTGYPSQGVASVTVVADTAVVADALATAAMVLGADEGIGLIEAWPGAEGMLITEDGEMFLSTGMDAITEY